MLCGASLRWSCEFSRGPNFVVGAKLRLVVNVLAGFAAASSGLDVVGGSMLRCGMSWWLGPHDVQALVRCEVLDTLPWFCSN